MKVTTSSGEIYEAEQIRTRMVKTILVDVYLDLGLLGEGTEDEISEEEIEELAHEDWLEAYVAILNMLAERFPSVDLETYSTDDVELEVVE